MKEENLQNESPEVEIEDVEYTEDEENSKNSLSGDSKIQKLKEKLAKTEKERDEYLLGWQTARAEFVNYKKEEEARHNRARSIGSESVFEAFLPGLDSFTMAFKNKEAWEAVPEGWRKGIEYIHNQFTDALSSLNISEIKPKEGDSYDPLLHNAVGVLETEDKNLEDKIASVSQLGYKKVDSIIRPAGVIVYKIKN